MGWGVWGGRRGRGCGEDRMTGWQQPSGSPALSVPRYFAAALSKSDGRLGVPTETEAGETYTNSWFCGLARIGQERGAGGGRRTSRVLLPCTSMLPSNRLLICVGRAERGVLVNESRHFSGRCHSAAVK